MQKDAAPFGREGRGGKLEETAKEFVEGQRMEDAVHNLGEQEPAQQADRAPSSRPRPAQRAAQRVVLFRAEPGRHKIL